MPDMSLLLAVFAPVLAGIVTMMLPKQAITARVLTMLAGPATSAGIVLAWIAKMGLDAGPVAIPFAPSLNMSLAMDVDQLGAFFALLVSIIGCLIVLYARGYFGRDEESLWRFYPTLGLFATAMMGVVLSDNFLGMFLFWELTSISSFLLIGWYREDPKSLKLALQALCTTGLGGLVLLAGLMTLGAATGEWNFSALTAPISEMPGVDAGLLTAAFFLIFAGAAAKSAQWPLHFWLPGAMAAPTPVSAYLHSATMVKAGVYLFARLYPTMRELEWWTPTLVFFGATTMLLGGYLALRSDGLKRIFAYTTVSQLGLLTCAYGLGGTTYTHDHHHLDNIVWPITQILNHAVYKAPLFIIAGAIIHLTHQTNLSQLKGLWRTHRHLALIAILAAYALAGLPFTLSFTAKEAFLYQIYHALDTTPLFWGVMAMAVLTAMCNVAIFVRITRTFFADAGAEENHRDTERAEAHHDIHEHGFWASCIWWPAAAILLVQFLGGIVPGAYESIFGSLETHALYWDHLPSFFYAITHPSLPLVMSALAISGGLAIGFSGFLRRPVEDAHNALFPATYSGVQSLGHTVFSRLQNGNLRFYTVATLSALLIGIFTAMWFGDGSLLSWPSTAPLSYAPLPYILTGILLTTLICASALILPLVQVRAVRVLVLGACGFAVTGMYIVYQAPDLALTQLMFEIISVVLFMLALRLLPEEPKKHPRISALPRAVFASIVGCVVAWVVLHAGSVADESAILAYEQSQHDTELASIAGYDTILAAGSENGEHAHTDDHAHTPAKLVGADSTRLGGWFLKNSYKGTTDDSGGRGGGGDNTVNVILVDFRGYDTIGEITVLAITLMGVLALLGAVPAPRDLADGNPTLINGPQPHLRSVLLRTAMKLILPVSLLFAGYIFFKGHNEPGGGFIAGLIASVGLAAYRMSEGGQALRRLIPITPGGMGAIGLAIALTTGLLPVLVGLPFFTSGQGYIPLPGADAPYHWTSVMFFDLGVFIVVIAVSVGMINRFEEELE
ncbi:MAG: hydrogen gas-evolving membrane-bound hydrogenase subunit E [Phycisphaerales bacterium JB050]